MKLTSKFNLGEHVWWIGRGRPKTWVDCKFCDTTGIIVGKSGEERNCPVCYGKRGKYEWNETEWMVLRDGHVGKVDACVYSASHYGDYTNCVEYMLEEHGVGSGSVFNESDLFISEEDALGACKERNPAL